MCLPPTRLPVHEQMFLINNADGRIRELLREIKELKKQLKEAIEVNEELKNKISLK